MEGVIWHGLLWNDGKDCFGIIYFGMSGTHEKTQPKSSFRQAWWRYVEMWSPYGFHLIHPGDTCHLPVIYRSFTCHLPVIYLVYPALRFSCRPMVPKQPALK